jgi:2-polyprenyl-3-methyl-5-hydroxy-6-metoxy-1,4-benzoquinol methylase
LTRAGSCSSSPQSGAISALDLEVLADFTGLSEAECMDRLDRYRLEDIAESWVREGPETPEEIHSFYCTTDHYVWELLGWNSSEAYSPLLEQVDRLIERWPVERGRKVLDHGAGVGTTALRLAEAGYDVTLADVPGRTLSFACARFRRRGLPFRVLELQNDVPDLPCEHWDLVLSFDVMEHVVDPAGVGRALVRALKPGGGAAIHAAFDTGDDRYPHHLASGRRRFGGHRWDLYLAGLGLRPVEDGVYTKLSLGGRAAKRAQYRLWRATGFYLKRLKR